MNNKNHNPIFILGLFIVFVIVFLIALGPYLKQQQIVTMGLLPILAGIAFLYDSKTIFRDKKEFLIFLLIFLLSLTSAFYYIGYEEFTTSLSSLFGAVIGAFIAIGLTKNTNYSNYFHVGYILAILILFGIMIIEGNIGMNFATAIAYRDRFMLNANAYSYFCIFANFSLFYLYLKFKTKSLLSLLVVLPILFLIIALTTQSRAGLLLLLLINLAFWLFISKPKNSSKFKKLITRVIIVFTLIVVAIQFVNIYQGSRLQNRVVQKEGTQDSREILFLEGIETFTDNPILGVGLGQFPFFSKYHLFTHNSYSEILAEQGVLGGILLFSLFLIPLFKSYKNFRKDSKNPIFKFYLLFFVVFLLYNNAYVFYKFPFSMMYFFLMVSLQKLDSNEVQLKN